MGTRGLELEQRGLELGVTVSVGNGVVKVEGLHTLFVGEVFYIWGKSTCIGVDFKKVFINDYSAGPRTDSSSESSTTRDFAWVPMISGLLLDSSHVRLGTISSNTWSMLSVYIGPGVISGSLLDGLGCCFVSIHRNDAKWCWLIDSPCSSIISRSAVNEPLQTGLLSVDTVIPVGRGQRELVLGDRQTGKTSLCLDCILNQQYEKILCVYSAIGLKASSVVEVFMSLVSSDCSFFIVFLLSSASASATCQYYCPYSATAIGEIFMLLGRQSCFSSLDDLSKHSNCYREISLILRRPPGREAYPGEVFFIHSRLLERSAKMSYFSGAGSLSCWPIIETLAGDIGGYIATNVISITDGQIVLSQELYNSGVLPAIDVGLSVTRVGSSAQWSGMKLFAGTYKLQLSQYAELKSFAQFSADLPYSTRLLLDRSSRVVELLKQPTGAPLPLRTQVAVLSSVRATVLSSGRVILPFNQVTSYVKYMAVMPVWLLLYVSPTQLGRAILYYILECCSPTSS